MRDGCVTVGIDQSHTMLEVARSKVPAASFEHGDVEHMPFGDDTFDLAVVSLALCHLPDPTNAVIELARVIAPGGTLVVADPHPMGGILGGQAFYGGVGKGRPMTFVRNHRHSASTWLRAFRAAGLVVVECIEAPFTDEQIAGDPSAMFHPDAARAALTGLPSVWVWELVVTDVRAGQVTSDLSTSSSVREAGGSPVSAIRAAISWSARLAGVGTPWSRPSRTISPVR